MTDVWKHRFRVAGFWLASCVLAFVAGLLAFRRLLGGNTASGAGTGVQDPIAQAQAQIQATRDSLKAMSDQQVLDLFNKSIGAKP